MVGFGLDYACAHIIIPASVNLLPIQADFVTERVIQLSHTLLMAYFPYETYSSGVVHIPECGKTRGI